MAALDYLESELQRLDLLLHREILRLRAAYQLSLDEFRVRAAHTGLNLTEEDIALLHPGYLGMLRLMARIPSDLASEAEASHVFNPLAGSAR